MNKPIKRVTWLIFLSSLFALNSIGQNITNTDQNSWHLSNELPVYQFLETASSLTTDTLLDDIRTVHNLPFKKPFQYKFYKSFRDSTFWIKIPIVNDLEKDENVYFILENAYLLSGDCWIVKSDSSVVKGHHHFYENVKNTPRYSNYPSWRFELKPNERAILYAKITDRDVRTRLKIQLLNEADFDNYKISQLVKILGYSIFILTIIIIATIFAVANKQPLMLLYSAYLFFFITDNLAFTGFGQTYLWKDSLFLISNFRSLSHTFIVFFGTAFFSYFYQSLHPKKWVFYVFRGLSLILIPVLIVYFLKYFIDFFPSFYRYLWSFLNFSIVCIFLVHVYLAVVKKLPYYLAFAFALPIIGSQLKNNIVPYFGMGELLTVLTENAYSYAIIIEIAIISFYVIKRSYITSEKFNYTLDKYQQSEKLNSTLQEKLASKNKESVKLKSKAVLQLDEITHVKSDGHYLEFYLTTKNRPEIDRNSMSNLESELSNAGFVRVHRSFIVNSAFIKIAYSNKVILNNGEEIPVSRKMSQNLKDFLA